MNGEIVKLLGSKYRNQSGIVYCFSRMDCERVAKLLMDAGIRSHYYHAGLPDEVESRILEKKETHYR